MAAHAALFMNPYSYNSVSLKKRHEPSFIPSAFSMIANLLYNRVGKALGLDMVRDWNKYYDRVFHIVEWARNRSNIKDTDKLVKWIYDQANRSPAVSERRIDDLYIYSKVSGDRAERKPARQLAKEPEVEKKVEAKEEVQKEEPKEDVEKMVDTWLKGVIGQGEKTEWAS